MPRCASSGGGFFLSLFFFSLLAGTPTNDARPSCGAATFESASDQPRRLLCGQLQHQLWPIELLAELGIHRLSEQQLRLVV
ncbi:uncharacterized protein LY79DRAFT_108818 [Colletotrichum navitas]|uniref:Secreted protein n=1 Tax=Colletotrichum navitas TaxID=681940 RepID=A0AAD8V5S0_9PEZI|nr:uncharacterized protein LY79DRAFT_108818 [Colletotrichum navitas]KAK1595292.1 hypothetical protein LY79DRAFT_108818 [Colletotrichum navitas]